MDEIHPFEQQPTLNVHLWEDIYFVEEVLLTNILWENIYFVNEIIPLDETPLI
jgi:hypothetical protein